MPVVLVLALLVGGGIWWYQDQETAPTKSDCEIVHELVDYKAASVKELDAMLQGDDQLRLDKYKADVDQEQSYVDQIRDPSIKAKAQAFVDADRKSLNKQLDGYRNPISLGPVGGPPSPEEREAVRTAQEIAHQFKSAKDELLSACPAASSDPRL